MESKSGLYIVSMLAGFTLIAGCSKEINFQLQNAEYRQQCFGDHSVHCRVMMVDLAVAKMEANIERFEKLEDKIVECRDRSTYDKAVALLEAKVEHLESLKPNFFMRTFLSNMEIEFDDVPFAREREAETHFASLEPCLNPSKVQATAAPKTPPPPIAASGLDQFDSNSPTVTMPLTITAGLLSKMTLSDEREVMALNGEPLSLGEDAQWQFPVQAFKLSGEREAVLMASSGGRGTSCETLFYFILANSQGIKLTPLFGTCSPTGRLVQEGDRITLEIPKMGGYSTIVYDGNTLLEDGESVAVTSTNDPLK